MNKSELDYIANILSHREFKHFFSVELSAKEFNKYGIDWAIEQALLNYDSEQIGEYNDGDYKLSWGSYSIFENGKKVTIHVFYDVYRYVVIDVNSLAVIFDTDFLADTKEYTALPETIWDAEKGIYRESTESDSDRIVYDTKEKEIYRHIIKEYQKMWSKSQNND